MAPPACSNSPMKSAAAWPPRRRAAGGGRGAGGRGAKLAMSNQASSMTMRSLPVINKTTCPPPSRRKSAPKLRIVTDSTRPKRTRQAKSGIGIEEVCRRSSTIFPSQRRPRGAAEGDAGRFMVRPLHRRGHPGPRDRRVIATGQLVKFMATGTRIWSTASVLHPQDRAARRLKRRRNRLYHRSRSRKSARMRSATPSPTFKRPTATALPGFKDRPASGVRGLFPTDAADFRQAPREPVQNSASTTRRQPSRPSRARPWASLPLRLSRPLTPGDIQERLPANMPSTDHHAPSVVYKMR